MARKEIELLRNEKDVYMLRANELFEENKKLSPTSKMDALEGVMDMLTMKQHDYEAMVKCLLDLRKDVNEMIQEEMLNEEDRKQ